MLSLQGSGFCVLGLGVRVWDCGLRVSGIAGVPFVPLHLPLVYSFQKKESASEVLVEIRALGVPLFPLRGLRVEVFLGDSVKGHEEVSDTVTL